jgi:hypothetical protein
MVNAFSAYAVHSASPMSTFGTFLVTSLLRPQVSRARSAHFVVPIAGNEAVPETLTSRLD